MRAPHSLLVLLGLSLAACLPPSLAECTDPDCIPATTGETGDPSPPTTGDDPGVYTVTGDEPAPSSTGEPDPGATTGAPIDPPAILDFDLDPNPITINGLIDVTVTAELPAKVTSEGGITPEGGDVQRVEEVSLYRAPDNASKEDGKCVAVRGEEARRRRREEPVPKQPEHGRDQQHRRAGVGGRGADLAAARRGDQHLTTMACV